MHCCHVGGGVPEAWCVWCQRCTCGLSCAAMRKQPKVLCTGIARTRAMQRCCHSTRSACGRLCKCRIILAVMLTMGSLAGLLVWLRVTLHGAALCVGPVSVRHVGHSLCEERDTRGAGVSQRQVGVHGLHLPNCWCVRVVGHRQAGAGIE